MRLLIYCSILLSVCFLSSCSTSSLLTSSVKPNEVTDVQRFETLSYISVIEKGNKGIYSETISNISKKLFTETLDTYSDLIHLTDYMI